MKDCGCLQEAVPAKDRARLQETVRAKVCARLQETDEAEDCVCLQEQGPGRGLCLQLCAGSVLNRCTRISHKPDVLIKGCVCL